MQNPSFQCVLFPIKYFQNITSDATTYRPESIFITVEVNININILTLLRPT